MPSRGTWTILEGGITQTFPLSINRAVYWTGLRRGECTAQFNTAHDKDSVLRYATKPAASPSYFAKYFVPESTSAADMAVQPDAIKMFWAYGRWWQLSTDPATPYRLAYSAFGQAAATTFTAAGYDDFNDDGNGAITQISTAGDGKWFILKSNCAYTLDNANGDSANFRRSSPYYGMGCSNPGLYVTSGIIARNVVASWKGDGVTLRHYIWDGTSGATELSRNVRDLAAAESDGSRCSINWGENLVISDTMVYDLDNKRVFNYQPTKTYASATTRPYYEPHYKPLTVHKVAFILTGETGSFDAYVQYGQSEDSLGESQKFTVNVTANSSTRFRHVWALDSPARCRVWRIKIDNLTGCGITQIEGFVEIADGDDSWDDSE